jgi:hypothetical protein
MGYYTKKDKLKFLEALKLTYGNVEKACESTNIRRRTIYLWREKEPWFKEEIDKIREVSIDLVENALFKNAVEGNNTTAQIFILKCLGKERGYIEKSYIDQEIKLDPIRIEIKEKKENGDKK